MTHRHFPNMDFEWQAPLVHGHTLLRSVARFSLILPFLALPGLFLHKPTLLAEETLREVPLKSRIDRVQPHTGIVLWSTNEHLPTAPVQLEFAYVAYREVATEPGVYDWTAVEKLLNQAAGRGHQMILRFHDTYVGKPTGVPTFLATAPGYRGQQAKSEGKMTEFPDWGHQPLQEFVLEFFTEFSRKYDADPRLAFVQVGFGLWAEYHIYDGPMELGRTFPSKEYQSRFFKHLDQTFLQPPWMFSVDAGQSHTPLAGNKELLALQFGLFDDSFNHKRHQQENEPNWNILGRDRWKVSPMGGEFSFFEEADQKLALAPRGPHGVPFEEHAAKFHLSFIIGDDQPRLHPAARILSAGQALGYRFHVTRFEANQQRSVVTIENRGIAPIYFDAYPAVNDVRSTASLKGLLPGESRRFEIAAGGTAPKLTIACDRLVPGQAIQFEAN